jgi:hypothetical protein
MPGPAGVPRADIIALLAEGHSDRYIGRTLNTATKRVRKIRAELGLPKSERKPALTPQQKWATFTHPIDGGHLAWTGPRRDGTPVLKCSGQDYSARRISFQLAHDREPVGRLKAGCDWPPCVAPQHVEDQVMRQQYRRIFGSAA